MDELRDLALFVAVARSRSFSRAAAVVGVPTSTLSRRIAALEASLGLKLLARTTRIVELTEAGVIYLARCEAIVEAAREAHQHVRGLLDEPRGVLRLSVEAEIGPRLVAPVLAAYLERFPGMRLDLDLSPRRVDLVAEGFDLAIRLGVLPDSTLTVRRLAGLSASLFAAPAYLERHGVPEHPAALAGHRRIHLLHKGDRGEWRLSDGAEHVEVAATDALCANNMTMIRHLARLGVGIAVVDALMARDDVDAGVLVPVLPGWTLAPVAISVVLPDRILPTKTRVFVDMLTAAISGTVGLVA